MTDPHKEPFKLELGHILMWLVMLFFPILIVMMILGYRAYLIERHKLLDQDCIYRPTGEHVTPFLQLSRDDLWMVRRHDGSTMTVVPADLDSK